MKKIQYIAALLVCLTTGAFAQTPEYIESAFHYKYPVTNDSILESFHYKYPKITKEKGECSKDGCFFTFKYKGEKKTAYFNEYGNWLRTVSYMDGQYIPDSVKAGISNSRYNGWEIEDARVIETPTQTIYAVGLDDKSDITSVGGHQYLYCTSSGNCSDNK